MKTTRFESQEHLSIENLPFVVRIASERDMGKIAALRAATYGKHLPELAGKLGQPESSDYELGCEVIVAASKLDGSLLGTLRTHANVLKPLPLQASIRLPQRFQDMRMVEATRLCVTSHSNSSLVRNALFKALFQYCNAQNVDLIMAAGRRPIDRIYDALLFSDVAERGKFYPMAHASGLPHRVMCLQSAAQSSWAAAQHPLYRFVFETEHADIDLSMCANLNFRWSCPENDFDLDAGPASVMGLDSSYGNIPFDHSIDRSGAAAASHMGFNAG